MRVAVIGAGIVGVTTAYFLRQSGCEVSVFEAETSAALLASKANGGQLSYSFTDAMADPGLIAKLPGILLQKDPALRIYPKLNRRFLSWALSFLANCNSHRATSNSITLLRTALRSAELMGSFHRLFGDQYSYRRAGKLVLLAKTPSPADVKRINLKKEEGCDVRIVSVEEAIAIEPSLFRWRSQPSAAIYASGDEVGDAKKLSELLVAHLCDRNVRFKFNCPVVGLERDNGRISRVATEGATTPVDAVVVCAGASSVDLLSPLGINVQIHPVAGYSVTLPKVDASPSTSITSLNHKIVFSRLDNSIRIAGFADINSNAQSTDNRIDHLVSVAAELAPEAADYSTQDRSPWVGHRPMTPNSLPIVGPSKVPGLFLNTGHGMLGWTLCAATGQSVTEQICGEGN